jgi:hypothetical protein
MRKSLSVVIFGSSEDIELISLKCLLIKCGIANFISKKPNELDTYDFSKAKNNALVVVSRKLKTTEVENIFTQARQFSIPILQL